MFIDIYNVTGEIDTLWTNTLKTKKENKYRACWAAVLTFVMMPLLYPLTCIVSEGRSVIETAADLPHNSYITLTLLPHWIKLIFILLEMAELKTKKENISMVCTHAGNGETVSRREAGITTQIVSFLGFAWIAYWKKL